MNQDYIYYQATKGICDICLQQIDAKIIIQNNQVFLLKNCPVHGMQKHLLEENADYHLKKVLFDKPATIHTNETKASKGCPYDCGLCENHEQHTCIGLIEITSKCNLHCPICYANCSGDGVDLPLETIEKMVDFYIDSEGGKAEILQISGGEPTLHNDILKVIAMCKQKNIGHIMLNTNGIRIAEDIEFVKELASFIEGFEIYLQFDSFQEGSYENLRGISLLEYKKKAIANLNQYNIPTTLVCTVKQGVNDNEVSDIINYGLTTSCVRGVNFQPVARFGNYEDGSADSYTVSSIIRLISETSNGILKAEDFVPLPCNVERVAITYLYKYKNSFVPITRDKNIDKYVPFISNTFLFTIEDSLSQGEAPRFGFCKCLDFLEDFNRIVPKSFFLWGKEERVKYLNENTFRISISSFVDKYNFELKGMQKECVHIITPDCKRIPFSAFNMIHRSNEHER